jgi:hypothetical protein
MTWLGRFRGQPPESDGLSVHSVRFDTRGWLPRMGVE